MKKVLSISINSSIINFTILMKKELLKIKIPNIFSNQIKLITAGTSCNISTNYQ